MLQCAAQQAETALQGCAEHERPRLEEAAAILRCNRGLALSETDLVADARGEVSRPSGHDMSALGAWKILVSVAEGM